MKSERSHESQGRAIDRAFYGSTVVGQRGQIVLPAAARSEIGIKVGEHLRFHRYGNLPVLLVLPEGASLYGASSKEAPDESKHDI